MLRSFRVYLFAVYALLGTSVSAMADANLDDVRCLMVYMQMGATDDPRMQTGGLIGTLYFMGKLDGRAPDLDVESLILAELPKMKEESFRIEAQRCAKELQARGDKETAMGQDLTARSAKIDKQKPDQPDKPDPQKNPPDAAQLAAPSPPPK